MASLCISTCADHRGGADRVARDQRRRPGAAQDPRHRRRLHPGQPGHQHPQRDHPGAAADACLFMQHRQQFGEDAKLVP